MAAIHIVAVQKEIKKKKEKKTEWIATTTTENSDRKWKILIITTMEKKDGDKIQSDISVHCCFHKI